MAGAAQGLLDEVDGMKLGTHATARRTLVVGAPAIMGAAILLGLVTPILLTGYWTKIATLAAVFSAVAAGAGLLYGRLGYVSLNQVALTGVGGWVFLRIAHEVALPSPVLLVLAGAVTCVIGTVIGLPSLRLNGLILALVSLMAAGAFEILFYGTGFPDGGGGFTGRATGAQLARTVPRPDFATSDDAMFRYTVIVVGILFLILWVTLRGRVGRAWAAIRQSEAGAYATGVPVTRYRLLALALTSFSTGVAGALLATGTGRLDPISFPAQQNIVLFAVVLIGGAYSLFGGVLAGLLYVAFPAVLNDLGIDANLVLVILGLGLVQALVTAPRGMAGQVQGLMARLRLPEHVLSGSAGRSPDRPRGDQTGEPAEGSSDLGASERAAQDA
ncbi:branched-chain amino acid ABC transporter permease [Streptomyces sp. NPDC058335]|uniref:branched-chain amino acid ABC transporter permease n=1 Tax=Streptomyces sp. NPDC058335 TaxID=3346451 RepID=UPI0036637654